jgi:hypothetical protein
MLSKQRRWQLAKIAEGLCCQCGKREIVGTALCGLCLKAIRLRTRKRQGNKPWRPGGKGRPPIEAKT